jgi:hypothetical protein
VRAEQTRSWIWIGHERVKQKSNRELESGEARVELRDLDRICELYGWPQTFVGLREA